VRRSCSTHIVMDAGEFRLSPGRAGPRCRPDGGRDSVVVTGPRWRSITRRTNDYRRTSLHCRPSRDSPPARVATSSRRAARLSPSPRRNSNQNFLAPRRTRSQSGAASCRRRHRRTVGRFSTRTILFGRRPSFCELDGWILVTLRDSTLAKDRLN